MKTAVSNMLISRRGLKGDVTELYLLHLICVFSEKEKDVAYFFFLSHWLPS